MPREPFLEEVARYYLAEDGAQLYRRTFIFPSKRAEVFFLRYLSRHTSGPALAPRCTTVNEYILGLKPSLRPLDQTALLFRLYDLYRTIKGGDWEHFDEFIFWGGIILDDFDLIDRYLIDDRLLYGNLQGLRELEDLNYPYLSEETKALIRTYWRGFHAVGGMDEGEESSYRARFLAFWQDLGLLYQKFQTSCREAGTAYEGYIYRQVAEEAVDLAAALADAHAELLDKGVAPLVFLGLFDLSPSELRLMRQLRQRGLAEFVWDEEVAVVRDDEHPAFHLLKRNKEALGSVRFHTRPWQEPAFYLPRAVDVYHCASTVTQVKALPQVLREHDLHQERASGVIDTAIILPEEQLLLPLVASIPPDHSHLNITLGYPLDKTSVSVLISRWLALLGSGYQGAYSVPHLLNLLGLQLLVEGYPGIGHLAAGLRKQKNYMLKGQWIVERYLPNLSQRLDEAQQAELAEAEPLIRLLLAPSEVGLPFLEQLDALLGYLAAPMVAEAKGQLAQVDEADEELALRIGFELNFLKHYQQLTVRLRGLIETSGYTDLSREAIIQLISGLTRMLTIPFKGNPLSGLQIMGLLESRSLHFPHLIYLSGQDGKLPKSHGRESFIPYPLRRAFGLPMPEEMAAVDAYRFYQTIARAEQLIVLYGEEDSLGGRGEESRYINQMRMLYGIDQRITTHTVELPPSPMQVAPIVIDKQDPSYAEGIRIALESWLVGSSSGRALSASAFGIYLECPLRFYYQVVRGVREEDRLTDLIESNTFGTIVHQTMEELYRPRIQQEVTQAFIAPYLEDDGRQLIIQAVQRSYECYYQLDDGSRRSLTALDQYQMQLIAHTVRTILTYDYHNAPFTYLYPEAEVYMDLELEVGGRNLSVRFKGFIDRLDEIDLWEPKGATESPQRVRRVLDYKTGGDENAPLIRGALLDDPHKNKAQIQTLLYCEMLRSGSLRQRDGSQSLELHTELPLRPGLLVTRQMSANPDVYSPYLCIKDSRGAKRSEVLDYDDVREDFLSAYRAKLTELYDETIPFVQTQDETLCAYCPFKRLCRRHE